MRIVKVVATDAQTKQKQQFHFAKSCQGAKLSAKNGGKLQALLHFCFVGNSENPNDVEVEFFVGNDLFVVGKYHGEEGRVRTVLKKQVDGRWQVVARNNNAIAQVQNLVGKPLEQLLAQNYICNKRANNFHGSLQQFEDVKALAEIGVGMQSQAEQTEHRKQLALQTAQQCQAQPTVSQADLDKTNTRLAEIAQQIQGIVAMLGVVEAHKTSNAMRLGIEQKLEETQQKYNLLMERQASISAIKQKLALQDNVLALLPKMRTLQTLKTQRDDYEKQRYELTSELEWQQKELQSIVEQLEQKQAQFASLQDKRNKIESINSQLARIASLYEKNRQLNEYLVELSQKQQFLASEQVMYRNKLDAVEKSIAEVKDHLEMFQVPGKSVGELLEAVRIDVKIDEVTSQIEKLQGEIAIKESQIAERESKLVVQLKHFRSVSELDVAVSPLKAKDTILQVLETKHGKLETINTSLAQKQRNLQRALEDYKYRILQLDLSKSKLEGALQQTLQRKEEEFKREVYLTNQRMNTEPEGVFAVTANFHDEEVESLKQEIASRNVDRDVLVQRASQLEGALKEIARHIAMNNAEMQGLQREKANIVKRYNEIVANNSSEVVFNYLKALATDGGTKYLLDTQQDAVRTEAEVSEQKRNVEVLKNKLSALRSRLRYLEETQRQLDSEKTSVDNLVSTNDRLKDQLTDIGGRMSAGYEQYKAVSRQLEGIASKLDDVKATIVEITKTVKVNERQIAEATQQAQLLAGSDDIEGVLESFSYDLGDVESERKMLLESKQNAEREVFNKRLQLEKVQWLYQTICTEHSQLQQEVDLELGLKGISPADLEGQDLDQDLSELRGAVAEFEQAKSDVSNKLENYLALLKTASPVGESVDEDALEQQLQQLTAEQANLVEQRKQQLQQFVVATDAKLRATVAQSQLETLCEMQQPSTHTQVVEALVQEKVDGIVEQANAMLAEFAVGYTLKQQNMQLQIDFDNQVLDYDSLEEDVKTAVFVCLALAVANSQKQGVSIVFEERLAVDKKVLAKVLQNLQNIHHVVKNSKSN